MKPDSAFILHFDIGIITNRFAENVDHLIFWQIHEQVAIETHTHGTCEISRVINREFERKFNLPFQLSVSLYER